jgi:hypothetical protein
MTNRPSYEAPYDGPERRAMPLSEDQIEAIAEKAADRAIEKMKASALQGVGTWTLNKISWIFTLGAIGLYWWMLKNGWIKP